MSLAGAPRRPTLASRLKPTIRQPAVPETKVQADILELLRTAYPDVFVFSIPNGGYLMDPRAVARLKWQGLRPGMPDLGLCWQSKIGFIEVKSWVGRLSPEQTEVHGILRSKGHLVAVCRNTDDLIATLTEWNVPSRLAT